MARRFELSDLDDVASFLEEAEESKTTVFITIGGRDRFAVVPADRYAAFHAEALKNEQALANADGRAQAQVEELRSRIDTLKAQLATARRLASDNAAAARAAEERPAVAPSVMAPTSSRRSSVAVRAAKAKAEAAKDADPIDDTWEEEFAQRFAQPAEDAPAAMGDGLDVEEVEVDELDEADEVEELDDDTAPAASRSSAGAPTIEEYVTADLPHTPIDSDDYQRSMWHDAITERMRKVIDAEAPVEKQRLFNAVRGSFGIKRSGRDIQSHNEWLFNRAIECQETEFNDATFVWRMDQDPEDYRTFRPYAEESGRQISEIAYEELAAAMVTALMGAKALSRDELIEATMRLLGYKRRTTRVRDVIGAAIERGSEEGLVRLFSDGTFRAARG